MRSPWRRRALGVVLAGLALATSTPSHAALCVPQAIGVPALFGAPNFLDPAPGEPNYWPRVDDPRWRGALARSFGDGGNPHVSFRALRVGGASPALYLSWTVRVAPQLNANNDRLRVAFGAGGSDGEMIEITPMLDAFTDKSAAPPEAASAWLASGSGWSPQSAAPTWVNANTRVWVEAATAPYRWAVNMRVPIAAGYDNGINLPGDFPIAFQLHVTHPDSSLVQYRLDNTVTLSPLPPDANMTSWTHFNIALPLNDASCDKGISITAADVGTKNTHPHEINLTSANSFFVYPTNHSIPNNVDAHKISAKIRIANWGTQADWNAGVGTGTLWKEITPSTPVLLPTNAGLIGSNSSGLGTKATDANGISYDWTLTALERCEFVGGGPSDPVCPNAPITRQRHQCLLIELEGGGLTYTPASIYRNMDFVEASTFQRAAQVSVDGLGPAPGGAAKRDVYLYLQTFQMPKDVGSPARRSTMFDLAKVKAVLERGDDDHKRSAPQAMQTAPKPASPGSDFETLNQEMPTYLVHAFHDSGDTITLNGKTWKLLQPQSSFGYYVRHDGPLAGWDVALDGARQIAPDYYQIAVAEGHPESVDTRIVARENDQRLALWLAFGKTVPQGRFGTSYDSDIATTLGVEYVRSATTSIEMTLGLHKFKASSNAKDIRVTQLGANGKWSMATPGFTPFFTVGAGAYSFDPGSTRFGLNAGVGVQVPFSSSWSVEARYARHRVAANAPNTDYSTVQVGLRHAF